MTPACLQTALRRDTSTAVPPGGLGVACAIRLERIREIHRRGVRRIAVTHHFGVSGGPRPFTSTTTTVPSVGLTVRLRHHDADARIVDGERARGAMNEGYGVAAGKLDYAPPPTGVNVALIEIGLAGLAARALARARDPAPARLSRAPALPPHRELALRS